MSPSIERLPLAGPPISQAYVNDYPSVDSFYNAGDPTAVESYRRVAKRIREHSSAERWNVLVGGLAPDDAKVASRLDRLEKGRGVFVATGQQAGLFVSPLFTLYKALTAVRLAEQLEEALEIPVMPLFSTASEDHDWDEVNHTHVIDLENRLVRLSAEAAVSATSDASPPVERIQLDPGIEDTFAQLEQAVPDSEFRSSVLTPLREAYRPGRGFAEAFEIALGDLLKEYLILRARTAHRYVKAASAGLMWDEWQKRRESEERMLRRVEELSAGGYEAQVPVASGSTNLFFEGPLGRDRIMQDGDEARLRRSGEQLSAADLQRILQSNPERVSPGALLRPVAEATAFPVIAYVGGPGEIAYLAQSQVLFDLHGVPAPVVVPRAAFQLVESKIARVLEKYELPPEDLAGDSSATISRLLKDRTPPELKESLAQLRQAVTKALDRVEASAIEFDPGTKSALGSGKRAVFESIKNLESKLQARVKEKNQVMQQQLEKAALHLYPGGRRQERVLNPYPYLVRYGRGLLKRIYAQVTTPLG